MAANMLAQMLRSNIGFSVAKRIDYILVRLYAAFPLLPWEVFTEFEKKDLH